MAAVRPSVFFLTAALAVVPSASHAALPLPADSLFQTLAESLDRPVSDARWRCAPGPDQDCECVELTGADGRVLLLDANRSDDGLVASRFVIASGPYHLRGSSLQARTETDGLVASWSQGDLRFSDVETALLFDETTLDTAGDELRVELENLEWRTDPTPKPEFTSCSEDPSLSPPAEPARIRGTAPDAMFSEQGWSVRKLDFGVATPTPVAEQLEPGDASPGLLPPLVRAGPDELRVTGLYGVGELPLGVRAHATTAPRLGAGVGWMTSPVGCDAGRPDCPLQSADLDVYTGRSGGLTARLAGELAIGTDRRHLAADADGLGVGFDEYDPVRLEDIERDRSFRDWGRQRAGVSLAGDHHDLSFDAGLYHPGDGGYEIRRQAPVARQIRARYGTRIELTDRGRAEFRLGHREFGASGIPAGRTTSTTLLVDRPWGSTDRMFIRPALRAEAATAVVDGPDGGVAGSRGHVDALVGGGLGLQGRWAGMTHRLSPRAWAGRRLVGVDAMPGAVRTAGIEEVLATEDTSFNIAGVHLDQRLIGEGRPALEMPVGAAVVDDGRGRNLRAFGYASVSLTPRPTDRSWRVAVDAICANNCSRTGLKVRLTNQWTRRLESVHVTGRGLGERPGVPFAEQRMRAGFADRFNPVDEWDEGNGELVHASVLRFRRSNWRARLRWFGPPVRPADSAGSIGVTRLWPALGWGIGADVAVRPDRRDWTALVGFRNSPAF